MPKKDNKNNEDKNFAHAVISWYPGHMAKTMKQIEEDLKLVDVVIEILDARIPKSSRNPQVEKLIKDKNKIIVLNKEDLADETESKKWVSYFMQNNTNVILCNSNTGNGINKIISQIEKVRSKNSEKMASKGRNFKITRAMILGIPNVGKSSFINRISNKNTMKVANKPGVTVQKQWIRLSNNIELLDTPGVLWPRLDNEKIALNLAYTGTIKNDILEEQEIAYNLIQLLIEQFRGNLIKRYNLNEQTVEKILQNKELEENEKIVEIMNYIGEKRGAILKNNQIDLEKTSKIILEDFRTGKLGRITLEKL